MYWWVALGYPDAFDLGKDGVFPRSGQVLKYYRERKMNERHKAWTQSNLATALGVTETMIRNIENKDEAMTFERRQFLSNLFGIPPILLGIITKDQIDQLLQERGIALSSLQSQRPISAAVTTHQRTIDIQEYRQRLNRLWFEDKITPNRRSSMPVAKASIDELYRELPHTSEELPQIQALLCDYHQFIAILLSDKRHYDAAIESLDKASGFARVLEDERKALVFKRKGNILFLANRIDDAVLDFERAWQFEKKLPNILRGDILLEGGRAKARIANTKQERKKIIDEIDLVGRIIRANSNEEDPHLLKLDLECYHSYKASALVAIGWNKEAAEELKLIKGCSQYPLRQVARDILQARIYMNRGKYDDAASLLESALLTAQELNSELNIARVEEIYRQLKQSTYSNSADVARLEYLLYYK